MVLAFEEATRSPAFSLLSYALNLPEAHKGKEQHMNVLELHEVGTVLIFSWLPLTSTTVHSEKYHATV